MFSINRYFVGSEISCLGFSRRSRGIPELCFLMFGSRNEGTAKKMETTLLLGIMCELLEASIPSFLANHRCVLFFRFAGPGRVSHSQWHPQVCALTYRSGGFKVRTNRSVLVVNPKP